MLGPPDANRRREIEESKILLNNINDLVEEMISNNENLEAATLLEEAANITLEIYGEKSHITVETIDRAVTQLNKVFMEFIENAEDQDLAVDIARKAIELVEFLPDTDDLKVATLNSSAYVFRMVGDYSSAIELAKVAIEICNEMIDENDPDAQDVDELACSYLTLSTIYHEQGNCKDSLEEARNSVSKILEYLIPIQNKYDNIDDYSDLLTTLCIGYQNIGCQLEGLNRFKESLQWYKRGLVSCQQYIPNNKQLLNSITESYNKVLKICNNENKPKINPFLPTKSNKNSNTTNQPLKTTNTNINSKINRENIKDPVIINIETNAPNVSHVGNSEFLAPNGEIIRTRYSHVPTVIRPKKPLYMPAPPVSNTPYTAKTSIIQQLYSKPKEKEKIEKSKRRIQSAGPKRQSEYEKPLRIRPYSAFP